MAAEGGAETAPKIAASLCRRCLSVDLSVDTFDTNCQVASSGTPQPSEVMTMRLYASQLRLHGGIELHARTLPLTRG